MIYDDDALYVGLRLHDRGRVTRAARAARHGLADADWLGLMIDSYHDHRTAFGFDLNPAGVRRDEAKTDRVDDNDWDAVWEGAGEVDSGGWTAEYRIPFSQLRFSPQDPDLGDPVRAHHRAAQRVRVFAFTPKPSRAGIAALRAPGGAAGAPPGRRLELLPYTVARARLVDPRGQPLLATTHEYGARVGRRPEVPRHREPHARRHRQPRLRAGGGGPGGGEPHRVRDLLHRAAAVLRGRAPTSSRSARCNTCSDCGCDPALLLAPHRPAPQRRGAQPRRGARQTPPTPPPSWAPPRSPAKRRRVVGGAAGRGHRRARRRASAPTTGRTGATPVEPLTNYFVGRARARPAAAGRATVGAMVTGGEPRPHHRPELRDRAALGAGTPRRRLQARVRAPALAVPASPGVAVRERLGGDRCASSLPPRHHFARPDAAHSRWTRRGHLAERGTGRVRWRSRRGRTGRRDGAGHASTRATRSADLGVQRRAARWTSTGRSPTCSAAQGIVRQLAGERGYPARDELRRRPHAQRR